MICSGIQMVTAAFVAQLAVRVVEQQQQDVTAALTHALTCPDCDLPVELEQAQHKTIIVLICRVFMLGWAAARDVRVPQFDTTNYPNDREVIH